MSRETKFVDVIVPLAVPNLYTYRVPLELNDALVVGQRVVVQFGKNKLYTAVVASVHDKAPLQYTAKYLHAVLDDQPIVNTIQITFWKWLAEYYCCTIGEVMLAALPAALKLSSETRVLLHPDFTDKSQLSDEEYLIIDALEIQQILSLEDISAILQKQTVYPHIKSLLQKKAVVLEEELKEESEEELEGEMLKRLAQ